MAANYYYQMDLARDDHSYKYLKGTFFLANKRVTFSSTNKEELTYFGLMIELVIAVQLLNRR